MEEIDTNRLSANRHDEFQNINHQATETANITIKSALLINGGAAVAVLSLLASFISKDKDMSAVVSATAPALLYFAWGVAISVVALALAYFTHYANLIRINHENTKYRTLADWGKRLVHTVAAIFALIPILCFVLGAYQMKEVVTAHKSLSRTETRLSLTALTKFLCQNVLPCKPKSN